MLILCVLILASVIYPSVLNLVQRFDQQRRGFWLALSYLSISIIILIYRRGFYFMCVSCPCPSRLFCFGLFGLGY
jgi:hypothetical protein